MNDERLKKINFWIYSVLNKIIPCCAITYLSLALIRMLYQSNERRHRLRSYGQQQFYSQASSSFYNANPIQNQLPIELVNSINSQKTKEKVEKKQQRFKSLPNSPNTSNPNFLDPTQPQNSYSKDKLSINQLPIKMNLNESVSSNNLIDKTATSALSPHKAQLKLDYNKGESNENLQTNQQSNKKENATESNKLSSNVNLKNELNSNQSLNQPLNLNSRNNSGASYIYPSSFNNRSCKINNNTNCDRTTRMLLAILFLFLITEISSGILNLLAGILGEWLVDL